MFGFAVYYAAVAAILNSWLSKKSLWYTSFLAIVISQTIVFGGDYIYRGYWDSWNSVALATSTALCLATIAAVAVLVHLRRAKSANRPG